MNTLRDRSPQVPAGETPSIPDAGVIRAAKRRQRRRRAVGASVLISVALAGYLALFGGDISHRRVREPATPASVPVFTLDAGALFSQTPYMGVACGVANSIACDRVGLTIWPRHPAVSVIATIAGRSFALDNRLWSGPIRDAQRTQFAGFLHPAVIMTTLGVTTQTGTRWDGANAPSPNVTLHITRRDHPPIDTSTAIYLAAGWG